MADTKYELRYLPLFYEDLEQKVIYISETLHNEKAIMERLPIAESFEPFRSVKERQYKYYRIYVKNFVIYYVVIDGIGSKKIMEVRRFLYNKQDREQLI